MNLWKKNVGTTDRQARGGLGAVFLLTVIFRAIQPPMLYVAFVIGLALMGTAYFGTCTLYSLLGVSTAEKKSAAASRPPASRRKR